MVVHGGGVILKKPCRRAVDIGARYPSRYIGAVIHNDEAVGPVGAKVGADVVVPFAQAVEESRLSVTKFAENIEHDTACPIGVQDRFVVTLHRPWYSGA